MKNISRRAALSVAGAALAAPALAQHPHHGQMFERMNQPGRIDLPPLALEHAVYDSPAPKAAQQGKWAAKPPLPLPRTEMAWAAALDGKLHLVGGYAEQRFDMPYHHVFDPAKNAWSEAAKLPRGANHVGVTTHGGKLYAFGGFIEQNRYPHEDVFVWTPGDDRWVKLRPLPTASGAIGAVTVGDNIHLVGGAVGNTQDDRKSVDWHLVYDIKEDRYREAARFPTARDHVGIVLNNGLIHLVGGRVDTFHTNSNLHHTYDPKEDRWRFRNPIPTARSGHGTVVYRGKMFCMGGEGTNKVFGQNEAYDFQADKWEQYAPMLTPRHGVGTALLGDAIHMAGGGPQMGGGVKSAVHEAFTLG